MELQLNKVTFSGSTTPPLLHSPNVVRHSRSRSFSIDDEFGTLTMFNEKENTSDFSCFHSATLCVAHFHIKK